MPISVTCAACSRPIKAADELAGRKVRCPQCGNAVPIPVVVGANPGPRAAVDLSRAVTPAPATGVPVLPDAADRTGALPPDIIPLAPVELEEAEPEPAPGRPGSKKRRKKKKRVKAPLPAGLQPWVAAYWPFLLGFFVAGFVWLLMLGITFFEPDTVLLVLFYGVVVFLTGMLWLYFQALLDGFELLSFETRGLGMAAGAVMLFKLLLIPVTGAFYLVFNIAEAWRAGLLVILGVLIVASGVLLLMVV